MRYKLEELYTKIKNQSTLPVYREIRKDINDSENDILDFLKDGLEMYANKTNDEIINDDITKKAIFGMKNINEYCRKFDIDKIFDFNDNDAISVYKCSSEFNSSLTRFNIENWV